MKVLFLGTPDFALPVLKRLFTPPFELVGVVSQPDRPAGRDLKLKSSPVKMLAQEKGFKVFTPEKISSKDVEQFRSLGAEVAVVVAFGQILSDEFLRAFPQGAVNVHASLLPRWRGAGPIQWSLLTDDEVTGVSLQRVVKKLDAGDVIGTEEVRLTDDYDAPKLYAELSALGAKLIEDFLPNYVVGKTKPVPQDESKVTIAPKISKQQGLIDWSRSAREIFSQIRALKPWPGTWTFHEGKQLKILSVQPVVRENAGAPRSKIRNGGTSGAESGPGAQPNTSVGRIIRVEKDCIAVSCGRGELTILEVQPESRATMKIGDYLRGRPMKEGDLLGS